MGVKELNKRGLYLFVMFLVVAFLWASMAAVGPWLEVLSSDGLCWALGLSSHIALWEPSLWIHSCSSTPFPGTWNQYLTTAVLGRAQFMGSLCRPGDANTATRGLKNDDFYFPFCASYKRGQKDEKHRCLKMGQKEARAAPCCADTWDTTLGTG